MTKLCKNRVSGFKIRRNLIFSGWNDVPIEKYINLFKSEGDTDTLGNKK